MNIHDYAQMENIITRVTTEAPSIEYMGEMLKLELYQYYNLTQKYMGQKDVVISMFTEAELEDDKDYAIIGRVYKAVGKVSEWETLAYIVPTSGIDAKEEYWVKYNIIDA